MSEGNPKPAAKKKPVVVKITSTPPAAPLDPPDGGAVVRMYCAGLGDCFLIGFRGDDGGVAHVMIDCGVFMGMPGASDWMGAIMRHLRESVGDRGLDLLVATHQHWDHLSGFNQAAAEFAQLKPIRQVWMPWTEDPSDPVAMRMADERRAAFRAALAAATRLRAAGDGGNLGARASEDAAGSADAVESLMGFLGHEPGAGIDALGAGPTTEDLLDLVRRRAPNGKPRYVRPSRKPRALKGVGGLKLYALGPPTAPELLGRDDPSEDPEKKETYLAALGTIGAAAFGAAGEFDGAATAFGATPFNDRTALYAGTLVGLPADKLSDDDLDARERTFPFDGCYRIPADDAPSHRDHGAFFRDRYGIGGGADPDAGPKGDPDPGWRRIDTDWLGAAEQLALNLDDHVNNTSLVLAFELGEGDGAPVLLFPGDAQVGNWLSWHKIDKDDDGKFVRDLLSRTVLYKVGHHASHNATLRKLGLEMMTNTSKLVAMIPVDEKEAKKPKGKKKDGWDMPFGKLMKGLVEQTEGRVVRADKGLPDPKHRPTTPAAGKRWDNFVKQDDSGARVVPAGVTVDGKAENRPFYIEYTVRPEAT